MKRMLLAGITVVILIFVTAFTSPVNRPGFPAFANSKIYFMTQDTVVPVKVEIEKTKFADIPVLFIHDTAATTEAIKDILGKDYGELMQYIAKNKLQPRRFMAWYYSSQPPWTIDVAVEADKTPAQLSGRVQSRVQAGGEAIIAHVWGPYDQVGQAYVKIGNWLKQNKRNPKGNSFEVYLNDPSMVKSPAEIRTDIYQPIE